MHNLFLKKFVGEFCVESRKSCGDKALTMMGIQSCALVNEGRVVMSHFIANNPDPSLSPIRMQGMLAYNSHCQRFESAWAGGSCDGIFYYHGRIEGDSLVFHQQTDDAKKRLMIVKFVDDDHFTVKLDPSVSDPDSSSLSLFSRL